MFLGLVAELKVGVEGCGSGSGCREMHLWDANLGDEGDEGKEPSSLEPRVGAAVGVERCTLVMQNLVTRVTKANSHHRWSRAWERWWVSRDATWESKQNLATRVTKAKSHHRWSRACGTGGGCRATDAP